MRLVSIQQILECLLLDATINIEVFLWCSGMGLLLRFGIDSGAQFGLMTFGEEVLGIGGTGLLDGMGSRNRLRFVRVVGSSLIDVLTHNFLRIIISFVKETLIVTAPSTAMGDWVLQVHRL